VSGKGRLEGGSPALLRSRFGHSSPKSESLLSPDASISFAHAATSCHHELPGSSDGGTKMTATPAHILPRHHLSVAEIDRLEDRLYGHNQLATGRHDGKGLAFAAMDDHGIQIGAIAGYSWAGVAEIKQFWVDENHRGRGLGRGLLEAAIAEAMDRGCESVWALSYTFQAPGLYEKCGFDRVAELPDWPPGHAHIVLRRQLKTSAAESTQPPSTISSIHESSL
jgi:GNAT superfamily N-acetyltransferase